jgi:protein subunit release factor A
MDEAAWLEVRAVDGGEQHAALFWSQDAIDAFRAYANDNRVGPNRPMRISRFDDLGL